MYHSDSDSYIQPFQGRTYETYRTPQQQAAHDQAKSQFLDALAHLLFWIWTIGPITLAAKAGFNWHELTNDKGSAAERGAQAYARWKWFQFATVGAAFLILGTWNFMPTPMTFLNLTAWWCLIFWLITYVRLAEFSLFRRGPVQWVMTPVTRALDNVHTWAIVLAALLPVPIGLASFY